MGKHCTAGMIHCKIIILELYFFPLKNYLNWSAGIDWPKPIHKKLFKPNQPSKFIMHHQPNLLIWERKEKGKNNTKGTWPPIFILPFPAQRTCQEYKRRKEKSGLGPAPSYCGGALLAQYSTTGRSNINLVIIFPYNASQTDPLASSPSASSLPPFLCCTYWLIYLCFKISHLFYFRSDHR